LVQQKNGYKGKIMNIVNFKPNKDNLKSTLPIGIFLISIGLIDIILNSLFNFNLTSFLPEKISFIAPLIFGAIGLYLIRIEFSGNKLLDKINKNFNSSSFNAILTLLVIFALIKYVPPLLNWFIFDADFIGNKKEDCTSGGACWVFVKVWFNRFVYGMYPDAEQWRINSAFIMLFLLVGASFFVPSKYKKYLLIFLVFVYPIIGLKIR
jgi:general L-amino acid transport system permease protein